MMKRLRQLLEGRAEDRGATLILVLFIVTVIGLAGAALLTLSDTSIRTTVALRDQAGNTYNADGAAQVAINDLSTGYGFPSGELFKNATNTTCFGTAGGTRDLSNFYPATNGQNGNAAGSASVVCTADPASGVNGTVVPITGANRPGQAIMTLGRVTDEDGINVKELSSNSFSVKGTIKSNSNINVDQGTLQSTTAVTAYGACSGAIVSVPAKNCNTSTNLADPNYVFEPSFGTPANAVPTYQPVPATCPGGVVTFEPGYYDDAIALTDLMTGTGTCGDSTWWFKPGTYYFDFHNNTKDTDVYRGSDTGGSSTANRWGITRGHLVAGTPTDINGDVIASPGLNPSIPGSCQNPIRSVGAQGVQFIFGGDSQLAIGGSADAEICGTYNATRPPIGVFGLKSGAATTTILTGTGTTATSSLKMSSVVSPGLFTNPTRVKEQAETNGLSTWVKGTTTPPSQTSTITVSGYAPPTGFIPAGSIVKSATIRVRHGNSAKYVAADKLALTFTPKGVAGSPAGQPVTPAFTLAYTSTALTTKSLVIQQLGSASTAFSQYVHENGFTGADMALAATLTRPGTLSLDSMQLDITYVTPAFRSENVATIASNCMTVAYDSNGSCAVLSTSALSNFTGSFYVQGTTYVPIAAVDLTLNNATQQVLRFGVISRSLWIKETGSFSYAGPVIEVPDDTPGSTGMPVILLRVFVCPATTTPSCSTDPGAIEALRVKAMMSGSAPAATMTILSWSNLR